MVSIQLYIETETIKRPLSPNWFKIYSDFALKFILLSVEKERHKIVADYLQRFLRISLFHFDHSTNPKGLHQCLLLNDSVSLVLRYQVCRKFTWTLYIQYSYMFLFSFSSNAGCFLWPDIQVCWSSIPYIRKTRWFFLPPNSSLKRQLVLKSQHKKRYD